MAYPSGSVLRTKRAKSLKNIGKNAHFQNPAAQYKYSEPLVEREKPRLKYLITEEIQALLAASRRNLRDHAIIRLGFHHGLRAAEIGMIQMKDYHPDTRMEYDRLVAHRLKGSIGGDMRLVPAAALAIRKYVKHRGMKQGALFLSRHNNPISRRQLDWLMKKYAKIAGVPIAKAHFHALKHTCATTLLSECKESIVDVQHHLGHADIRSTMIYAKLTEQANDERAARLRNWR